MRIALLTSTFPLNRTEQDQAFWILEIIEGLRAAGHSVAVYTQHRNGVQDAFDGIAVERFPWPSRNKRLSELSMRNPLDVWAALRLLSVGTARLPDFLKRHDIELCLVFWALPSGWYTYRTLRKTGVPYRIWALGSDINKYGRAPVARTILGRVLRAAETVFADSFELARRIETEFGAKCFFLATTRTFATTPTAAARDRDAYTFLYVGRLAEVKGIDVLMEAARALPEGSLLRIAGAGPLGGKVNTLTASLGDRVEALGRISDEKLAQELMNCDCVVIPSRSETIPIVLNEALQFGKRLIVTDVGDMGYIVRKYKLGEVVPSEDVGALKDAMTRAATGTICADYDPDGWREARTLFDPATTIERLCSPETTSAVSTQARAADTSQPNGNHQQAQE